MMLVVILGLFVVGDVLWAWYMASRLRSPGLRGTTMSRIGLAVLIGTLVLVGGALATMIYTRANGQSNPLPRWIEAAVMLWHLLVLPITLAVAMLGATVCGTWAALRRLGSKRPAARVEAATEASAVPETAGMTRRQLLVGAAAIAPPAALVLTTGISLPRLEQFRIREIDVPVPNLPRDLEGLTIAHLSDTHLGDLTPTRLYRKMIDATNALHADLIVHTGDVINVDSNDLPDAMAGLIKLEAPLGVYVCEGNHDLIQSPGKFWKAIRAVPNIKFLRNDGFTVTARGHPLQLLGLRWGTHGEQTPSSKASAKSDLAIEAACEDLAVAAEKEAFTVALAHHPHAFDYAPFARVMLSGHTHGGQLMLTRNIGPGPLMYRYWSGTYRRPDRTLVVSNGAGNWFPLRINAPAEIVKLTLRNVT